MTKNNTKIDPLQYPGDWRSLQGPLSIRMTNDYLFRALLQRNKKVLKALICSLLHLEMSDVKTEPAWYHKLGNAGSQRRKLGGAFSLLSLQRIRQSEQRRRLWRGQTGCAHWKSGFHTFEDAPEFYATYWMMNEKSYRKYSDKLRLSVLDLNCIKQVTEEDRRYKIDYWAGLFKSTTWEEIKMYAESDEYLQEVADTVYKLTQEEKIRQQCEAREDYYRRTAGRERLLREAQELVREKQSQLYEKQSQLDEKQKQLHEQQAMLEQQSNTIERGIRILICSGKTYGESRGTVAQKLEEGYGLSTEQAEMYVEKYWEEE